MKRSYSLQRQEIITAHLNLLGRNLHFILDQGLPQWKFSSTQIIMYSLQNVYTRPLKRNITLRDKRKKNLYYPGDI